MAKTRVSRVAEYVNLILREVKRLARREGNPRSTVKTLADETKSLAKHLWQGKESPERRKAMQYVREGVENYNTHDYDRAGHFFSKALSRDDRCALAWTYLGNTHYKLGHLTEAITSWQRAADAEPKSKGAEMAREKLMRIGKGSGTLVDNINDQMMAR